MATLLDRPTAQKAEQSTNPTLDAFLAELAELSRRHGIAIADGADLYVMEPEDFARSYQASDDSVLTFA